MAEMDLVNRDPNNINDHVKVAFEDVLAEPEGAHSIDCVWQCSHSCFEGSKGCCYNIMSLLCAIPYALVWGWGFAVIAFYHIWTVAPFLKCFMINCGCCQKFYGTCLQCCLGPICESFGLFFSNIVVKNA